jgi:branched-subunit amino acid transport protein
MAQAVSRRPLTAEAGFAPRSIYVGFVVDKMVLGQVFLRVLRFSPVTIIPPSLSKLISEG